MKFSLIQIDKEKNGLVNGAWLQDYTGEFDMAVKLANETEKVNGNRIKVAVVEQITGSYPFCLRTNLKRLG